jgi:hypothetical protein
MESEYKTYTIVLKLKMTQEERDKFDKKLEEVLKEINPNGMFSPNGLCTLYRLDGTEIK